ncbi:MAG TPA: sarcosine oxidase subunit gamma family protein [Actinophytocola sp.]|nr:sarcosine oxidase subunit gamma family protein [Actinophytocola sp.]
MTDELPRSPLAGVTFAAPFVRELPFLAMVDLRAASFPHPLPGPNRVGSVEGRDVLWLGPDEWLVVGPPGDAPAIETLLRQGIGDGHGSVVDVSANRTTLSVAGPHARDVLAKGCSIDLHPSVFAPGHCAQTLLARAQVILRQVDAEPTYHVLVRGSFAPYLAEWLADATREFG